METVPYEIDLLAKDAELRKYICEGCQTYISAYKLKEYYIKFWKTTGFDDINSFVSPQCDQPATFDTQHCPCSTCLVKMICDIPCDEYLSFKLENV